MYSFIFLSQEKGYLFLWLINDPHADPLRVIPVFFSEGKRPIRVEVQIRTIAMDFWASLEHQIKYKKNVEHAEKVIARLKECADEIAHVDETMLEIRTEMDSIQEKPTDIEALYEKLKKIDINLM